MDIKVYSAIAAVQGAIAKDGIGKDRTNTQGVSFKYRGIDDVYNALAPILSENKLCILPRIMSKEVVERVSKSGGALFYTTVAAEFDLVSAEDGSKHTVSSYGEAMDSGDKSIGKAMSYAYKAMAFMTFCVPTEGDNDPDAQSHEVAPKATVKPQEAPQATEEWNLEKAGATLVSLKGETKAIKDWDASARSWMAEKHANPMVKSAAKYYNEHEVPFA
jgi:hypothetical protein